METLGAQKFRMFVHLNISLISKDYIQLVTTLLQLVKIQTIVIGSDKFRFIPL